jgi:glutamine synthetase
MSKSKLEYIWLDGYKPTQSLRSKTKIVRNFSGSLDECPMWSFDGSSTEQAPGGSSDCLLSPVAIFPDPARKTCLPGDDGSSKSGWCAPSFKWSGTY